MARAGGCLSGSAIPEPGELLAALPVAVLVVGPDDRVVHANAACEELVNMSERAMRGQPLDSVLSLPDEGARREGQAFAAFDTAVETPRGVRIRADLVEGRVPEHDGWRMIVLHNTAQGRRIGDAADRSGSSRAAIGAAAMLAHEIKNPLSGIRGAAQLMAGGGSTVPELTTLIVTEVDRIAALIDRMQGFTDTRPLPVLAENIYPLLDHARSVAKAGFARDIPIEERFDPSLPPVLVNRDALLQVILNLLKNASEALGGQDRPRLILTTAYRHGMAARAGPGRPRRELPIEVAVLDNGPGAPADIADHLFDPFVSGRPGGQGLGLALVDKLVRDMGGIIQYAREGAPEMTVFRMLLPRAVD